MSLRDYGWDDSFARESADSDESGLEPGRVLLASANLYRLITERGELRATLSGRLRHSAASAADLPVVGDWVLVLAAGARETRIELLLPRRTRLSRKVPGKRTIEQVVAANVDTVIVVMGLDGDFNLRRLERLLATVWESGARPLVLLNKLDLCDDPQGRLHEAGPIARGVPVLLSSCVDGEGLEALQAQIGPRETAVLVGSSGVGKSTLINRLLGATVQATREVRQGDDRGRHTTSHRELFRLPGGGMLIDNPGIREVQLWAGEESLQRTFDDLVELAERCRFRDCSHETETGCAVLEAVEAGELPRARLESYRSLQKEQRYLERRQDQSAQQAEKAEMARHSPLDATVRA